MTADDTRTRARSFAVIAYLTAHPDAPVEEVSRYASNNWRRYLHLVGLPDRDAARALTQPETAAAN